MSRILSLLYGIACYAVFVAAILYAIAFVNGLPVPRTIDIGPSAPFREAVVVNVLLLSLFAVQHSVMARQGFKRWWTRIVPVAVERSTYVLLASLVLILLMWQWRPIPAVLWQIGDPAVVVAVQALSFVGWGIAFASTFMINHFELFGLQQVMHALLGRSAPPPRMKTPLLYNVVRHPLYLGFIVAFWAAPTMTVGHLLFAAVTTAYIFVGITLEERDLTGMFGDEYRAYRRRVGMLLPFRRGPARPDEATAPERMPASGAR